MAHHFPYLDSELQQELKKVANDIVVKGKGILAQDEFNDGMGSLLQSVGQENTAENRRRWRELIATSPGIEKYISGIILFDETVFQKLSNGKTFPQHLKSLGIHAGIKVDRNTTHLEGSFGESSAQGLDDLLERAKAYRAAGCTFAKFRCAIRISEHEPSALSIADTAYLQARYARICQQVCFPYRHKSINVTMNCSEIGWSSARR